MRRNEAPKNRRFYTETEKTALLDAFAKLRLEGSLAYEAAANLSVPLSSILRWQANAKDQRLRALGKGSTCQLEKSFKTLYQMDQCSEADKLEALFILVGWLRCSSKPDLLDMSVATLLIAFASLKFNAKTLYEVPLLFREAISRHIRLVDFLEFCALNPFEISPEFPTFWDDLLDDQPYDDRDELARMCWCLFALSGSPEHGPASLNKTMYLMNAGVFKYKWNVSRRTRDKLWRMHAPASPFFYIERFHSAIDLSLKPHEPDFLDRVEDLLENPLLIRDFLRRARAAVERLIDVLDSRALKAISFPTFPDEIIPLETKMPALSPSIVASLSRYKSADK